MLALKALRRRDHFGAPRQEDRPGISHAERIELRVAFEKRAGDVGEGEFGVDLDLPLQLFVRDPAGGRRVQGPLELRKVLAGEVQPTA